MLRLPKQLHERVQQRAAANNRSMNSEIALMIEQALEVDGEERLEVLGGKLDELRKRRKELSEAMLQLETQATTLEISFLALQSSYAAAQHEAGSLKKP